ncbi:transposase [uncultured Amaricoccus sp.]|uniref:transposase n=1 Tax=uncultured Amaricoccus sp. TaxID=339341 RepID=UPI00261544D4|nr:transposase [uncultured Amaricoccus sp.]
MPAVRRPCDGPVHLAVDATGLKVHGEGEWKVRVHGPDKRRVWRQPRLAVDTRTGDLRAHGEIAFGAPRASLDLAYGHVDVSFDWEGDDDMHEVRGSGSAELLEDGSLEIEFDYHNGDDAILKAIRDTSSAAC